MDYISGLNDKQKEAVLHGEGPLLILAGAGSGKTRVLTHRIAYLIENKKIDPSNILAITFTNKAAREMRDRIDNLLGRHMDRLWAGTFHSICVKILRFNINKIGYDSGFSIYDRDDQLTVVKECIKDMKVDTDIYKERVILNTIGRLKDDMVSPIDYVKENYSNLYARTVGEIYSLYEQKLRNNNALDFDDLILKTVELLKRDADTLDYYSRRFQYIFVDEFQDTNGPQYELIRLLSSFHKNLAVVGDDDQSIYGFRGADIENILNFEKDFSDTKVIKLEENYRSTKNILNIANHVIKNNYDRKDKELWTGNQEGHQVTIESTMDEREEARFVVNKIEELMEEENYTPKDFAILYRTNAQSRNFEEAFMRSNIPYKLVGGLKFYGRKEIKDIVAYLSLIQNPTDNISLRRIINIPKRGIGNATMEKIEEYANGSGESLYSALLSIESIPGLSKRAVNNLRNFTSMVNEFIVMKEILGVQDFIEKVLNNIGYIEELEKEKTIESHTRLENIKEFVSVAVDFEMENPDGTVEDFLSNVSLLSDVDKTEEVEDAATMLTVHSSKGLEYPVIFMVGMEEGLFPNSRSADDEKELEEERRLCYVAITRAEERLFITFAKMRTIYGRTNYTLPSRFVEEMPRDLVNAAYKEDKKRVQPASARENRFNFGMSKNNLEREMEKEKKEAEIRIEENKEMAGEVSIGTKVKHKKWGTGMIVQIKERNNDSELTIAFDQAGIKRVLLSIAPIEIL